MMVELMIATWWNRTSFKLPGIRRLQFPPCLNSSGNPSSLSVSCRRMMLRGKRKEHRSERSKENQQEKNNNLMMKTTHFEHSTCPSTVMKALQVVKLLILSASVSPWLAVSSKVSQSAVSSMESFFFSTRVAFRPAPTRSSRPDKGSVRSSRHLLYLSR